jgi:hypothetical protein
MGYEIRNCIRLGQSSFRWRYLMYRDNKHLRLNKGAHIFACLNPVAYRPHLANREADILWLTTGRDFCEGVWLRYHEDEEFANGCITYFLINHFSNNPTKRTFPIKFFLPNLSYVFRCVIHHLHGEIRKFAQTCQLFTRLLHKMYYEL